MVAGSFTLEEFEPDEFNLKPKDNDAPIPHDQQQLQQSIYATWNLLKLLRARGCFKEGDEAFSEFRRRLLEAAKVGCVQDNARTDLSGAAVTQIRDDLLRRKGNSIVYRYLTLLAVWAAVGVVAGAILVTIATITDTVGLAGYGWVIMGSMFGAWVTAAARRRSISLTDIPEFIDRGPEPFLRMLFVGIIAAILALCIQQGVISINIGDTKMSTFSDNIGIALLLGLFAGVSERAISDKLLTSFH